MQRILNVFRRISFLDKGLVLLVATLLITTVALASYLVYVVIGLRQSLDAGNSAATTTLVLQDLEIQIESTESALRGYVITGDDSYLKTYEQSLKLIPNEEESLASSSSGISHKDHKELNDLIATKLAQVKSTIGIRKAYGAKPAMQQISSNRSNHLDQAIRDKVSSLALTKVKTFQPNYHRSQNSITQVLAVTLTVVGFVCIVCGVIIRYFQRAIEEQTATEGTKNEFLSLASHQLRTPATNVKQYLEMLRDGYMGKLTPDQQQAIDIADYNNEMGINIINNLLDVAKMDLDKIKLDKKSTDLYEFCRNIVKSYTPKLKFKNQTIELKKPRRKITAPIDRTYLEGALENIIDNANKYCPDKSTISIEITTSKNRDTAYVYVHDNGPGMSRKDVNKLFKKFSRLNTANTTRVEGSGLGLYWVKRVLELHGGEVRVKSDLNKGSTFRLAIPR